MACRPVEITIVSDLKDVNLMSKTDVYAVVSISGGSNQKQKTPVDRDSGPNAKWNHTAKFWLFEETLQQNQIALKIKLVSNWSFGDIEIGEVQVPIKELLDNSKDHFNGEKRGCYRVQLRNGKAEGALNLAFKFGEKYTFQAPAAVPAQSAAQKAAVVMAYPASGHHAGPINMYPQPCVYPPAGPYPYPPPGGYPYPPPGGYPYPPPPPVYGYPAAQPNYGYTPQKPSGGNMVGGLVARLLGGLWISDGVSDFSDYGAGYFSGFDDADGFDF